MTKSGVAVWQTADLSKSYLEGIRGAIPLAGQQITVLLRLIRHAAVPINAVLDLGCGDGILGQAVLDQHPGAHGVFLDFSPPMLAAARKRLADYERATFVLADYGSQGWLELLAPARRFDVIVSGYSIHHQPDQRKQALYRELYRLLSPGGIFINMDHVASRSAWGEALFSDHFIDALHRFHQQNGDTRSRQEIAQAFFDRPDKEANILAPVESQCDWLREIGFRDVDCFFKLFELAIFGGIR